VKAWPVQEAKARFSEFLETCLREGPQLVTRRGQDAAVLVPVSQWERLTQAAKPTLKELLLTNFARAELELPRAAAGAAERRAQLNDGGVPARYQRGLRIEEAEAPWRVLAWLSSVEDRDIHLSAVTLGEIQAGIEVTREQDAAKAADIEAWRTKSPRRGTSCRWTPPRSASGRGSCIANPIH